MKIEITILDAIKTISGSCDWAKQKDGVGFNAADAGMNTVACYSKLTQEDQETYRKIIYKYKHQLGIDSIDQLKVVDYGSSDKVIKLTQADERVEYNYRKIKKSIVYGEGQVSIFFDYEPDFVTGVKTLQGRKFNGENKSWTVPVTATSINSLQEFLEGYYFDFDLVKLTACISEFTEPAKPTKTIELNGESLIIKFDYEASVVVGVKKISGRKFDSAKKCWTVKLDMQSLTSIMEFHRDFPEFVMTPDVMVAILETEKRYQEKLDTMQDNIIASASMSGEIEIPSFKGILRPFQKAGVNYILKNKRVIVGDEMGLGKTIEAIAAIEHSVSYPALISCPNSLKYNWRREFKKFTDRVVAIINSDTVDFPEADVYITNYNSLVKFADKFSEMKFKAVLSDESHYLKNQKAQRTTSFTKIVEACNPELVLLLTGTTIVNRPNELLSPLSILGKLDEFGGFWNFAKRYCNAYRTDFGLDISGSSNLSELHTKLRSMCYIRREKKDVLTELPAKTRQVIELDIDNRAKYEKAKDDIIDYLRNEVSFSQDFLDSLDGLPEEDAKVARTLYRENKASSAEAAQHLVKINELKKLAIEGKLNEVKAWIGDVIGAGEKLVVFTTHVNTVNSLVKEFKCNKIDGSVSSENRDLYVQDFQTNPETLLIVVNLAAGKEGLTLTAAHKLAFTELGWTPGEHDQAEDRIHRIGQAEIANMYYLIGTDTIDVDIFDLIEAKREVTNAVNKGTEILGDVSVMNELIKRLIK